VLREVSERHQAVDQARMRCALLAQLALFDGLGLGREDA
jgi:hypothetical protein